MAADITNSPYLQPLPRAPNHDVLGYSRHYARRMRDAGKTQKESWIKKLWTHVFTRKKNAAVEARDQRAQEQHKERLSNAHHHNMGQSGSNLTSVTPPLMGPDHRNEKLERRHTQNTPVHLPPIHKPPTGKESTGKGSREVTFAPSLRSSYSRDSLYHSVDRKSNDTPNSVSPVHSKSAPPRSREMRRTASVPFEFANSPYLPPRDKGSYKSVMLERQKDILRSKESQGRERRAHSESSPYRVQLTGQNSNQPQQTVKPTRPDYANITTQVDTWRNPRLPKGVSYADLEERAKKTVAKAMKANKIFMCEVPYPMDAYIRFSLRQRGWVEKFNPTIQNSGCRGGTSSKLECADDEDFEQICEQGVPAPWEEEHGLYAMMSRLCRHYPAKFIWGGRNVNSLVIRSEVVVNHFTKARHFSSKTGIVTSLRELMWYISGDPNDFFPRCFLLCEEERDDIIEDFRITMVISILKWVIIMSEEKEREKERRQKEEISEDYDEINLVDQAQDGDLSAYKSETVECNDATGEIVVHLESEPDNSISDSGIDKELPRLLQDDTGDLVDNDMDNGGEPSANQEEDNNGSGSCDDVDQSESMKEPKTYESSNVIGPEDNPEGDDRKTSKQKDENEDNDGDNETTDASDDNNNSKDEEDDDGCQEKQDDASADDDGKDADDSDADADKDDGPTYIQPKNKDVVKVLPEIQSVSKKGGTVPMRSVDWALSQCERYLKYKEHVDIDQRTQDGEICPHLTANQWDTLTNWYYKIAHEGAKVSVSEEKVEECEAMLQRMHEIWPQQDIDGLRNIWIIKPGAKSKGMGIEFHDRLDDILKYIDNTTLQGNYVVQKYIERPLLLYGCKFDIRQWFLVTDWNPLTIWMYKDCYLRICSQKFSYDSMHESVHLSNVAVQQFYLNDSSRDENIPDDNYMDREDFQNYLNNVGAGEMWEERIYPGMKMACVQTLMSTMDITETRKSAFELYGADFMISEDYRPWLLEINSSPGMAPSSVEKAKLCAQVIEDTIKVVIDHKENKNCDTGNYELAFRDHNLPNNFRCVDNKINLKGIRIKRADLEKYCEIDKKAAKSEAEKLKKEKLKAEKKKQKEEEERKKEEEKQAEIDARRQRVAEQLRLAEQKEAGKNSQHSSEKSKEKDESTENSCDEGDSDSNDVTTAPKQTDSGTEATSAVRWSQAPTSETG